MNDTDDWMQRLRETTDRFREAAEVEYTPQAAPLVTSVTPSGASARNAYHRVQRKKGQHDSPKGSSR